MSDLSQQPVENQENKDQTFGQTLIQFNPDEPRKDIYNVKTFLAATSDICYSAMHNTEDPIAKASLSNAISQLALADAIVTASLLRTEEVSYN